ncbi:MAG: acyl-ACP--UDP-N-acetylglucosamine O-acyltransferase [Gammaproteobacteria bacterium]
MTSDIHNTAIVSPRAELGAGVKIGPYAVIGDDVEIGADTSIGPHTVIEPFTRIGARNRISAHTIIGGAPQDLTYDGSQTWLEIGDDNIVRELVTLNRSTNSERPTTIGSHCFFMAASHVGHDCQVGDHVVLTNGVLIGGHVEIGDHVNMGGAAVVHQFCRIGKLAMVRGTTPVNKDVLPFCMVAGDPVTHYRLNSIGLRRAGINGERYRALERAFRDLRAGGDLGNVPDTEETAYMRDWLAAESRRGLHGFVRGKEIDTRSDKSNSGRSRPHA